MYSLVCNWRMASWLAMICWTGPISQRALPINSLQTITQHILKEWVGVGDPSCIPIQDQDAILGRLEESAVASFAIVRLLALPISLNDYLGLFQCRTPFSARACAVEQIIGFTGRHI